MIISDDSIKIINELNENLISKTVQFVTNRFNREFKGYNPWMALPCLTDAVITDFDAFSLEYDRGELVLDNAKLSKIKSFLLNEGLQIWISGTGEQTGISEEIRRPVDINVFIESVEDFSKTYSAALKLIDFDHFLKSTYQNLVELVVPLHSPNYDYGFSTHLARGVIFKKVPTKYTEENVLSFAIDLVHELGHQVLMIFQSGDSLLSTSLNAKIWSGIRKTERPAIQAFQGLAALSYMGKFLNTLLVSKTELNGDIIHLIETKQRRIKEMTKDTIDSLQSQCKFTKVGAVVVSEFEENLKLIS